MKKVFALVLAGTLAGCGPSVDVCYSPQSEIVGLDATGDQLFESLGKMRGGVDCHNGSTADGEKINYSLTPDFYLTDGQVEIKATDKFIADSKVPKLQVKIPKSKVMVARNIELIDPPSAAVGTTPNTPTPTGVNNTIIINNDAAKK